MNGMRLGVSWFIATLAYITVLMIPSYGLALAPIIASIILLAMRIEPKDALLIGFLAGLAGYFLLLGVAGGLTGIKIMAGIGGPITVVLAFSYHLITPAALAYAVTSLTKK